MSNEFAEYCDRLWKIAYERGKTEGVIRCRDCKYYHHVFCTYIYQIFNKVPSDFYCGYAERKEE